MSAETQLLVSVFLRWSHIMFGIIWLGHLFFLNLVNVPLQKDLDGELKAKINPKLLLRAFYWFRWGAMYTFIFGWILFGFKYLHHGRGETNMLLVADGALTSRGLWMLFGALLGTVMWFNVWFLIWPRQKLILGSLAKGSPHPDAATLAAFAGKVSRLNLYLSGPMLFGMVVPNNFAQWGTWGIAVAVFIGCGFWLGMVKRSFKIKTVV